VGIFWFTLIGIIVGIALAIVFERRKKPTSKPNELLGSSRAYLQYLTSIVLGACSEEAAYELCKIRHIWEIAVTPAEYIAAFQLSDGVASIALDDAKERLDSDCLAEIDRTYRLKRNQLLWSIRKYVGKEIGAQGAFPAESIAKSKRELSIRFCHLIKSFPKGWEHG